MKIGIISDTHGLVPSWEKAMRIFEGADLIIHAGDVLYHPPRLRCNDEYSIPKLVELINSSPIPVIIAKGNCDAEVYEELLEVPVMSPYAVACVDGIRLVAHHGHGMTDCDIERLAAKYRADVFITGHTHQPVIQKIENTIFINPGSPSHPHFKVNEQLFPTVGVIIDDKVQIVGLETNQEIMSETL